MRDKDPKRVFVYRSERLHWRVRPDSAGPPLTVVEQGRRNWRVSEGDFLLFTEGHGLDLRFVAYSEVLSVKREQIRQNDINLTVVTALVQRPLALPPDLLLGRFMYSLAMISNFGRPWLHLRHKSNLPAVDFETLSRSRLAWDRTVFFGLLRDLPGRWREFFENESRALSARSDIKGFGVRSVRSDTEPVRELLTLVEATLLSTSRLAADIQISWTEVFGVDSLPAIQVVEPDGRPESWDVVNLLRGATRRSGTLERGWTQINELNLESAFEEGQVSWRPHRW